MSNVVNALDTNADNHPVRGDVRSGQEVLRELRTNEVFVAIVGPAGAGAGTAAKILSSFFKENEYQAEIIKASSLIRNEAEKAGLEVPIQGHRKTLANVKIMQDRGDELRKGDIYGRQEDHSAVARLVLGNISECRANLQGVEFKGEPIIPDGAPRVFIIDSLRHPEEVSLFRELYQDSFSLIGIVCDPIKREERIRRNFFDRSEIGSESVKIQVKEFLNRDENAEEKYGQHVSDTFYEADFFVDNTQDANEDLTITGMNDHLRRFVNLITQKSVISPTTSETAMHHARSSQMRSACLSRQVGAALVNSTGNIVATGANDVPKAGGGIYGNSFSLNVVSDHRCAFREKKYCSSNKEQNNIIDELINAFPILTNGEDKNEIIKKIRKTRLGGLIEFSRAVHAEMDAILSASISGVSPKGCRMYVTTYPCHYCARHIIAAGIDEVQFIEPYPKSKATELHDDAIAIDSQAWVPPSEGGTHVLFRPFVGVAPRLYRRVFLKVRDYKNKVTGDFSLGISTWGRPSEAYKEPYSSMEIKLSWQGGNND
ncbi:anti-phage dCTP deaminase [Pectobacterium versatile]|uniref:anti-phage dCTP deaminase n=1 Tax=Pectobacterium versatile TaxID=2488639 RepID=UPI003822EFA7